MKPEDFVHLHCYSTYSLLQALPSPEEIVLRAKELGQRTVALTDIGITYGLMEFFQAAEKHTMKPILGMEIFVQHGEYPHPLVLLAETTDGYRNLLTLATAAALGPLPNPPTLSPDVLAEHGAGLIALTSSAAGAIPQAALREDVPRVHALTEQYRTWFGERNLYYELLDLPLAPNQREINQQLIRFGKELSVPLVVGCGSRYCHPEDAEAHDVLLCIQQNAHVEDPGRMSLRTADYSMRPFDDLAAAFSHIPNALEHTRTIADRCAVSLDFHTHHIPRFPIPDGKTEMSYLRELCEDGFIQRYHQPTHLHRARLSHELTIIERMGFAGYFLIVADFINEARRRSITVGPGRGSAAGSIVSYCLNITTLDPIEHSLLFERFLNPERVTLPDIDTDFADNRRDEILTYVREKYGADRVIQICTFGTLAARAAVKDVGRAYGIPFYEMNQLAKLIPERPGTKLHDALSTPELHMAYEGNATYRKIIDAALKLEGKARHVSIHACGVIITEEPALSYTALQRAPKDETIIITQYAAKPLESLGLLKIDFLGLTNLTVIQTTLAIIDRTRGANIDITTISLSDPATFALLQRGETTGVFQFESAGMRRYLRQLKPTAMNDIIAMAALFRPGPMEWIPRYIRRKHGLEPVEYLHPDLEPIFRETYGIGVYQEQILQLAQAFAGFSLGEADLLRRAIGKKIKKELDAQREKFIKGAERHGHARELAVKIFDEVITPFAGYGFVKAHAAGYARIAYETAYLKAHYPAEFMAALLSGDAQRTDRIMIEIDECRHMGLKILPPDINESLKHFTVIPPAIALQQAQGEGWPAGRSSPKESEGWPAGRSSPKESEGWGIRFGLSAIKGIGESSVEHIMTERNRGGTFLSIEDFARRIPTKILNKKSIEALAKSGALDSFGERRAFIEHYDRITEYHKLWGQENAAQADLFGTSGVGETPSMDFPPSPPLPPEQKLLWEKETLGLYVSSHPLAGLRKYIKQKAHLIAELTTKDVGRTITLAGIPEGVKKIRTKKNDIMGILTLEDPTGKIEVTLFPRMFADVAPLLEEPDTILVIGGTLDVRNSQLQVRADAVKRVVLSTLIARAKSDGLFDGEDGWQRTPSSHLLLEKETVDLVDDEGNIIAGEQVQLHMDEKEHNFLGPLSLWILDGLSTNHLLPLLSPSPSHSISIHTISLPRHAPKQLLLDLKHTLSLFPGKERVQLRIGEQTLPLPLTISMSTILEQKIDETLQQYADTPSISHRPC